MWNRRFVRHPRVLAAACAASLALSFAACGSEEPVKKGRSELVADWLHPACAASALLPPAPDTCAGPWSFGYRDLSTSVELCGVGPCLQHKSCTSWHRDTEGDWLGAKSISRSDLGAITGFQCDANGRNCRGTAPTQISSFCATKASQHRTSLLSTELAGLPASVTSPLGVVGRYVVSDHGSDGEVTWTTWQCIYDVTNYPTIGTGSKPVCGCQQYEQRECERRAGTTVTATGELRPTSPGAPTEPGDRRVFATAPQCLTCDELPFETEVDARAKAQCLMQQLATATGELRTSLASRLQLLFQLAGDRLTEEQAAQIRSLYSSVPGAGVACRVPLTLPDSCQPEAGQQALPERMQLCQDLLSNPNSPPAVAALEFERCLAQADHLAGIGGACRLELRDASDTLAQGVLRKAQPSFAADLPAALATARTRLSSWWQIASLLADGDSPWLYRRSGDLLRWFWQAIELQRTPLPAQPVATDSEAAALLADIGDTRLSQDISVLSSLFAPGQLGTPPLLMLTGDALEGLSERTQRLMPMHDVACRLAQCAQGTLRTSATSELVRVLATLPDAAQLAASLAAATHLQAQQPALFSALLRVRDQHLSLVESWAALGRPEPFSEISALIDPPPEVETLAGVIRAARLAWQSYQRTGMFSPWTAPRVSAATLRKEELLQSLAGAIASVSGDRDAYIAARRATLNDMLELIAQGNAVVAAKARWDEVHARQVEAAEQQDALLTREAQESARSALFQRGFEELMSSGAVDSASTFSTQTVFAGLPVHGTDAKYLAGTLPDLVRDRFAVVPLAPGETLRARVTGSYAPDCALRRAQLLGPGSTTRSSVSVPSPATGPDGYWVAWQGSAYMSQSTAHTTGTNAQVSVTAQACGGASAYGNGTTICASYSLSHYSSISQTGAAGREWRRSSTFNIGLRVGSTPFPDAPVGSLLAVVTKAGTPTDIRDVQVVSRDAVLTAPALLAGESGSYEVHLVVNDAVPQPGTPACHADDSALALELVRTVPVGNIAVALGGAMASALRSIDARAEAVIRQGELSGAESNLLRADAWVALRTALPRGIGISQLPAELRQYFEAALERELASLARRAQLRSLAAQQLRWTMELDAIGQERNAANEQSRLRHLIPRWRLRDLAGAELTDTVQRLAELMTVHVAPLLELHAPTSLTTLRATQAATLDKVIGASLTTAFEAPLADFLQLANAIRFTLVDAAIEPPSTQRRTIVVAIPRPPAEGAAPWVGPFRTVSEPAARAFWASAFSAPGVLSNTARVSLSPADLYSPSGGMAQLDCLEQAPVVRHFGIYLATDGWMERLIEQNVLGIAASAMPVSFPTSGRSYEFVSADPLGIAIAPSARNGETIDVLSSAGFGAWPVDLDAGAGISPFTSFQLKLGGFQSGIPRSVFDHAQALLLVMEVERRVSTTPAWVPGVCQLTDPASP